MSVGSRRRLGACWRGLNAWRNLIVLVMALPSIAAATGLHSLIYTAPRHPAGGENRYTLRLRGDKLELSETESGVVSRSQLIAATSGVVIQGANGNVNDTLIVDFSGGMFSLPEGIRYDGGEGGYDTLVIAGGTAAREVFTAKNASDGVIAIGEMRITYSNIE